MFENSYLLAALLGIVEGFTEFLPVSSTGHLLLLSHLFGFKTTGRTFEVLVQLGAILAILSVYCHKIIYLLSNFHKDVQARRFLFGILLAFFPAVVIGLFAHNIIKTVFFETPSLVCFSLILGGLVLLAVDKANLKPRLYDVERFPYWTYLTIGLCQCVAMIPGVSRSGATVVGAMLCGSDKRSAAEFSFFLAMPTMLGAFILDLYKNYSHINTQDLSVIGIGFVFAFISALFVVKTLLDYISRNGFTIFAYWRIVIGTLGLILLY